MILWKCCDCSYSLQWLLILTIFEDECSSSEHLRANYVTTSLLQMLLFPVFGGCTATILCGLIYPKMLFMPEKQERKKIVTSHGIDRHCRGPGRQKSWLKGKTSGDTSRKCSGWGGWQGPWRTRLQRPQRPGPLKDADPELRHNKWLCFALRFFATCWSVCLWSLILRLKI